MSTRLGGELSTDKYLRELTKTIKENNDVTSKLNKKLLWYTVAITIMTVAILVLTWLTYRSAENRAHVQTSPVIDVPGPAGVSGQQRPSKVTFW